MANSRAVLREGFVFKEREQNGPADAFYCVLRPSAICFHLRKVHKRHTPLGMLKLSEISIETQEYGDVETQLDCNSNTKKFPWQIITKDCKLFFYSGTNVERDSWIDSILEAKTNLSSATGGSQKPALQENFDAVSKKEDDLGSEVKEGERVLSGDLQCSTKTEPCSVYNSLHTELAENNGVGTGDDRKLEDDKTPVRRLRSRSLSEPIYSSNITEQEEFKHCLKSKSAPPETANSRRAFKTVDKLIDMCIRYGVDSLFVGFENRYTNPRQAETLLDTT